MCCSVLAGGRWWTAHGPSHGRGGRLTAACDCSVPAGGQQRTFLSTLLAGLTAFIWEAQCWLKVSRTGACSRYRPLLVAQCRLEGS